jgi:type VI secretion system protein ImpD
MIDLGQDVSSGQALGSNKVEFSATDLAHLRNILQQIQLPESISRRFTGEVTIIPIDWDLIVLWLQRAIAQIDNLIIKQLNNILHHEKFQDLERAWRSLFDLIIYASGRKLVKVRVLDINWSEITKDVNKSVEFDQSQLFQKIYSEEYDVPGGEPYGVIVLDFEISHKPFKGHSFNDVSTLEHLAEIGAASFSPMLINAAPELFELDSFEQLSYPIRLRQIFAEADYIAWNRFREHPDTRFMGITLPRVILRRPYNLTVAPHGGILFSEKSALEKEDNYLWGYANFALAKVLIREFTDVGWFSHIRGMLRDHQAGGVVDSLIADFYTTDANYIAFKPVVEAVFSDERERSLSELGFIPLCQCYDVPMAVFYSTPSIHSPKTYTDRGANNNAKLSAMLQHVLCGSRFAHYIKIMTREMIGSVKRAEECQRQLQAWLNQYVTSQEDSDWYMQARYPLREASVEVKDVPDKPGSFWTAIHLRPHYQADRLVSELHLTTEVSGPA